MRYRAIARQIPKRNNLTRCGRPLRRAQKSAVIAPHQKRCVGVAPQKASSCQSWRKNFGEQPERKRAIGAGARRDPLIGVLRSGASIGIDADQLGAALLCGRKEVKVDQAGIGGIAAPEQNHARVNGIRHFMPPGLK
jgi:hypothetical protein